MIRIFSSNYPEKNQIRRSELLTCFQKNVDLGCIDSACLLVENDGFPLPHHQKLKTHSIAHRPQYEEFFRWANELVESPLDISIIANSDIYFDTTLLALANSLKPHQCAALSRWDVQPDGSARLFDRNDSQDVWVFRGKLRPVVADFCVGIPRCDNRILHELRSAGYEVINPAFSVRTFHLHAGSRGEYPGEIQGLHVDRPYAYLWPHNLLSLPETLWHRWRCPETKLGWRFDWRKLQRTLPWRVWKKLSRQLSGVSRQQ